MILFIFVLRFDLLEEEIEGRGRGEKGGRRKEEGGGGREGGRE